MTFQQYPSKLGIPSGNTAGRPSSPVIGDTYYNGENEILEIYNGTVWVAVSAPPSTPQITSVTDASTGDAYTSTAGKLTVVFVAGSGGGTPSQYNAFTVAGGHSASSSSTTVTLTGLTPGTSYEVYGNGQNNFGTTVNTPNQAAVTPTTRPQSPTIGTATASLASTDVTVTWTLGNNGGKNLSAITITPYLNGTTAQTSQTAATTSSTSHTFTGLTAGSAYTFKVKTTNANGDSPESAATNSVTITTLRTVDYLVVAGGAGGGYDAGGGGGAGGVRSTVTATGGGGSLESPFSIGTGNTITVTVGNGGNAQVSGWGGTVTNGGDSSIAASGLTTITATGGGAGGPKFSGSGGVGTQGGSGGGGGGGPSASAGAGTANQGFVGGSGLNSNGIRAGSGGGAAAAGVSGSNGSSAVGGAGVSIAITGSSVFYGGGGGGGGEGGGIGVGATSTSNGGGGAGAGAGASGGSAGTANTGGGGGGGAGGNSGYVSFAGGSGVVILRTTTAAASTTGSPVYTTGSGYHIYKFTGNGTITY